MGAQPLAQRCPRLLPGCKGTAEQGRQWPRCPQPKMCPVWPFSESLLTPDRDQNQKKGKDRLRDAFQKQGHICVLRHAQLCTVLLRRPPRHRDAPREDG